MALRVVGSFYKDSAWPQLRKGAVTCRASWFLQIMDAQRSKERWEKTQGQELDCSWRWAEVSFLPCRALSHSMDFGLALPACLLLHFLGRKWYFLVGMLLWLDTCIANACLKFFTWFQRYALSVGRWAPYFTCCLTREQPVPSKSRCARIAPSQTYPLPLKSFSPFFNVDFLMEWALEEPGRLTCEK